MWSGVALAATLICFINSSARGQVYNITLNDFIDANLEYFQEAFPPNENLDGKLLFGEVDVSGVEETSYINVRMKAIEDLGRLGDFLQMVNLDSMENELTGSLQSRRIALHVDQIVAPWYFGALSPLTNVSIDLASPQFDIIFSISPSSDGDTCSLNITMLITVAEVILKSDIPFANNRNITDFFDNTIVNYFNTQLSSLTIALTDATCDPITTYLTLFQGLHTINNLSSVGELLRAHNANNRI